MKAKENNGKFLAYILIAIVLCAMTSALLFTPQAEVNAEGNGDIPTTYAGIYTNTFQLGSASVYFKVDPRDNIWPATADDVYVRVRMNDTNLAGSVDVALALTFYQGSAQKTEYISLQVRDKNWTVYGISLKTERVTVKGSLTYLPPSAGNPNPPRYPQEIDLSFDFNK